MISICIPVYNFDVRPTVERLASQMSQLSVEAEIVCIDDCSTVSFPVPDVAPECHFQWIGLEHNVGRARIRNMFLRYARHDYLLFLDCDSLIPDGFLRRYIAQIASLQSPESVVCGGRVYDAHDNTRRQRLRYRYGTQCESKAAAVRSNAPYKSFMTNNFIVHRAVLERVPFDERISQYGHEDTLFGYCLMQQGVPVIHLDNPVVNGDVESNREFLRKTQAGVQSLVEIYRRLGHDSAFVGQVALLKFYRRVQDARLIWAVRLGYGLSHRLLEWAFARGLCVNMTLFAFYKLGLFVQLLRQR